MTSTFTQQSRTSKLVAAAIFLFMVTTNTSCAKESLGGLKVTQANTRLGTAIWLIESCPSQASGEETAALLAPLVAMGADFAVNFIQKYLEKRAKDLTGQFVARGHGLKGISDNQCLIVARGLFGPNYNPNAHQIDEIEPDMFHSLGLADLPALYVEFEVKYDGATDLAKLTPAFVIYGATAAKNKGKGVKSVTMALALSEEDLKDKDEIEGNKPFAVFRTDFGRLQIGKYYTKDTLQGTGSAAVSKSFGSDPVSFTVLVTESEEPGIAMVALTEAFKAKKSDLQKALEGDLGKLIGIDTNK